MFLCLDVCIIGSQLDMKLNDSVYMVLLTLSLIAFFFLADNVEVFNLQAVIERINLLTLAVFTLLNFFSTNFQF